MKMHGPFWLARAGEIRFRIIALLGALVIAGMGISLLNRSSEQEPQVVIEGAPHPGPPAPRISFRIVDVRPHDPGAFTQGLLWHEGMLYESTGLYGRSSLREADPRTGRVVRQVALDARYFGEGLALVGTELLQLTWKSGTAILYDLETFRESGRHFYDGEGWGLTYDGRHLLMTDGSSVLQFRHPHTFRLVRRIRVFDADREIHHLNELEYVGGHLFANVFQTNRIARIDPGTGRVTGWLDLDGLLTPEEAAEADVLNGIAWDPEGGHLLVTGKLWPKLFVLEIEELD